MHRMNHYLQVLHYVTLDGNVGTGTPERVVYVMLGFVAFGQKLLENG